MVPVAVTWLMELTNGKICFGKSPFDALILPKYSLGLYEYFSRSTCKDVFYGLVKALWRKRSSSIIGRELDLSKNVDWSGHYNIISLDLKKLSAVAEVAFHHHMIFFQCHPHQMYRVPL